jgi:hypothetical protein
MTVALCLAMFLASLTPFEGAWRFAGGDAEREAVEREIDTVAGEMNFLARGIARRRLREGNAIAERLVFRPDGATLTVEHDARAHRAPLDGTPGKTRGANGDRLKLTYAVDGDRLVQTFDGDNGGKTVVYRVEGGRLTVDVTVRSKRLPRDLRYRLTYARE